MVQTNEEIIIFLCTNLRSNSSNLPSCGQTLSDEDFKNLKLKCRLEFGLRVKLVSTKCQGVCPKNSFYGTLISIKKVNQKPEFIIFKSSQQVISLIKENLNN